MTAADAPAASTSLLCRSCADTLLLTARTPRTFAAADVPASALHEAHRLCTLAPTAFNSQPMRVAVLDSHGARQVLIESLFGTDQELAGQAPLLAVIAADPAFHRDLRVACPALPWLADAVFADPDHRRQAAINGAHLQLGYLILALRAVGLAAAPLFAFEEKVVDDALLRDSGWLSVAVLAIGYPAATEQLPPRAPRRAYDAVFQHR